MEAQIVNLGTHPEPTITVAQFASYWGVSCRMIQNLIVKGALPATKIGRNYRIRIEDARAFGRVDACDAGANGAANG